MNLVLLVEGAETEPRVYRAWLAQRAPALRRVANVADLTSHGYVLVSGGGYPSCYRRIDGLIRDIHAHPGKVDALWLCIDSEEDTYENRHAECLRVMDEVAERVGLRRAGPQSRDLVEFKRFYDVSSDDPEQMGRFPGFVTRQSFHLAYLQAMLAERSHRYSKRAPGVVLEPSYLAALEARCGRTAHLRSLHLLLDALKAAAI